MRGQLVVREARSVMVNYHFERQHCFGGIMLLRLSVNRSSWQKTAEMESEEHPIEDSSKIKPRLQEDYSVLKLSVAPMECKVHLLPWYPAQAAPFMSVRMGRERGWWWLWELAKCSSHRWPGKWTRELLDACACFHVCSWESQAEDAVCWQGLVTQHESFSHHGRAGNVTSHQRSSRPGALDIPGRGGVQRRDSIKERKQVF